eukprot:SAG31_NODE_44005_length_264_cov_1.527273_1_plen_29_part_10
MDNKFTELKFRSISTKFSTLSHTYRRLRL